MNGNEEQMIFDTMNHFIDKGLMFTAFDVTKAVRKLGLHILHNDVKPVVHGFSLPSNYKKKSANLTNIVFGVSSGANLRALVYHPEGSDVNNYTPLDLSDTNKPQPDNSPNVILSPVQHTSNPDNVFDVRLDNRGRYCVKAKVVSAAGFVPGDTLYVNGSMHGIEVTSVHPGMSDTVLTVDCYKNFLIFSNYFRKCFGNVPSKVLIVVENKKLTIKEI
jgi:hypothetical protein